MSTVDVNGLRWWKASRSDSQGGECVEVADGGGRWFVRDSKDPAGGMLTVSTAAWHAFLDRVRPHA